MSAEPMSQRMLAIELRYRVDVARQAEGRALAPIALHIDAVRELVATHPLGVRSAHVRHNLGPLRLRWMKEKELIR